MSKSALTARYTRGTTELQLLQQDLPGSSKTSLNTLLSLLTIPMSPKTRSFAFPFSELGLLAKTFEIVSEEDVLEKVRRAFETLVGGWLSSVVLLIHLMPFFHCFFQLGSSVSAFMRQTAQMKSRRLSALQVHKYEANGSAMPDRLSVSFEIQSRIVFGKQAKGAPAVTFPS
ncbi:hypothetical protein J3R30DRAFT_3404406 [Lentinula aciculospora]|uniref:Uncharacterized protein n=1 Tax=Lentinula aciculospora TaxID=153920 RepID=A0A9W9AAL6_9AGAR|nr:hypothetical protein J3R30DRAFT_3404406 [Lentinula aciculospora]